MKTLFGFLFCAILSTVSFSQKNVFLTLSPKVGGADLQMATDYVDLQGTVFNISYFDYYVSNVQIIHDGGQITNVPDTVFLVEPQNHVLYLGYYDINQIEQINFGVGVPPNINTQSGADAIDISAYPAGHPLSFQDPSMHWGWTAGYIFMIIGGNADSNADGIADAYYELHSLGDLNYANVIMPVVPTNTSSTQIDVYANCNIDVWLKNIPVQTIGVLHGSSGPNALAMKNPETEAVFTQDASANVTQEDVAVGNVFFASEGTSLKVVWNDVINANAYKLTDMNGKLISTDTIFGDDGSATFTDLKNGVYMFRILDANGRQLNTLKIVK